MTLPTLILKHKKSVIETRVVHFSSLWQQAFNMAEAENGSSFYWDAIVIDNPEQILQAYNKYLGKYIKTTDMYKTPKGVAFALNNGSGFHLRKRANNGTFRSDLYLTFLLRLREKLRSNSA